MAKVRLKSEWKLWVGAAAVFLALVVYLYFVSRPPMESGEYLWHVTKILGPDSMKLKGSGKTIEFRLAGLVVPSTGGEATQKALEKTLADRWVRIKPLRRTPKNVEVGLLFLSGEDMLARLIRQGLGTVDRNEKDLDVRPYIELELEAKRARRGLWATKPASGAK